MAPYHLGAYLPNIVGTLMPRQVFLLRQRARQVEVSLLFTLHPPIVTFLEHMRRGPSTQAARRLHFVLSLF